MKNKVFGDLNGIKDHIQRRLEDIYAFSIPFGQIVTRDFAMELADLTAVLNREIAVFVNRRGKVVAVSVGEHATAPLPEIDGRRGTNRLSGIRCIHTHPNGQGKLSAVDMSALTTLRFDCMVALGVAKEEITDCWLGILAPENGELSNQVWLEGPFSLDNMLIFPYLKVVQAVEKQVGKAGTQLVEEGKTERALLVGVDLPNVNRWEVDDSLEELAELATTAGAEVVGRVVQKRTTPDSSYYIGLGKIQELSLICQELHVDVVVFDDELSPAQQRNIELQTAVKIVDRTALILDIFAQRARTKEGKLQVELAQLKYVLPRLTGQGSALSRLGGGIGTRGPGETKLEVDRRRIRKRINDLETDIDFVQKHRQLHRQNRLSVPIPVVSLVGYTNAGKSTLLNALTQAGVLAEDKLFATLDPTTRKVSLPGGHVILLTDTVGFIQKLPHHLVAAFRATLEEVIEADLLLHVVDCSHPKAVEQSDAVYDVLKQLKAHEKPIMTVLNKIDRIDHPPIVERLKRDYPNPVAISALYNKGLEELLTVVERHLTKGAMVQRLQIPYTDSGAVSQVRDYARVISEEYMEDYIEIVAEFANDQYKRFNDYLVKEKHDAQI